MKSGWKAIDDIGIEIDDETKEMTLENSIKFVRFYGINAVSKFSDNMLQLFGNEALRVIGKAIEDGYTLQKWIPCSERLPEPYDDVIISAKGYVCEANLRDSKEYFLTHNARMFIKTEETDAWMQLPKPYEGRTE